MAIFDDLAALDAAHRAQQQANAAEVARILLAYWILVQPDDVSGSGGAWLDRATSAVLAGHAASARIASAYVLGTRRAHGIRDAGLPEAPVLDVEAVRRSLAYTGLGNAAQKVVKVRDAAAGRPVPRSIADVYRRQRRQIRGAPADVETRSLDRAVQRVMTDAGAKAAAAAVRHVQNGGRDLVRSDRVAIGYVRITHIDPCYFCAMLASRGPVYRADSFSSSDPRFARGGEAKVHDDCRCAMRPVYTRNPFEWPEKSQELDRLWRDVQKRKPAGVDPVLWWRQNYEGRSRQDIKAVV